ncbi:hypothetical protein MCOR07_007771 [Pyricularia oryzae]|uniref:2EXR domain-containing protein n=1 Tax=Pyricularia oryzae (strain 70-15 / ATCC MYA-4617 / FGSC 8958) TaxID=242507 RepID=G4NIU7_PYRO7|nr:uncharacterized protein MGG_14913 [Pyricularia oryzae 70-15]KAI6372196.1 hypothetical protein MCOR32_005999 [Pyricularia oryzae]EHA47353.1 hypothetical protein MGG_14913 [Pyricularia oryzae 70-15]KAI6443349.1 hypothetical protein MCOR22_005399 [Pyricularia oryzae]KAI6562688.1 hypothetical protein MCOR09_007724 [Pyricularia oryzae]KAI6616139.1 hypothetical protein MCOR07_007771 [Pyricularia oryzae]
MSFQLFTALPAELRLEVWRLSFQPRAVEVRYQPETDECRTITHPPAVLQVCRESREEALRFYHKCFGTKSQEPLIYFNSSIDILYIPRHRPMGYDDTSRDFAECILDTAEHVKMLAVDHVLPDVKRPWETYNKLCLMLGLPNLKEAYMIISTESDDGESGAGMEIEIIDPKEDQEAILKVMKDIEETYSHELGEIQWEQEAQEAFEDDTAQEEGSLSGEHNHSHHHHHHLSYPPIVPKAKISHGWEKHGSMVRCI